ncbi:AraC family transcriptional regulator [Mesorhizobium sp. SARCC-RB16n]|uniref:AraC family transcriptional regulator n=1 Tax=Mesorhizobium sp. SARCC-RB16n TaxID=2116687 RepID=UPI0016632D78|nr:AraC family transcriptional regulator [Mesorhizobium sp. SARCC-RB16n]
MDPLSQIIALSKPQALAWRVIEAHDAWCIRFPTTDVVVFGQVIEGRCQVELADGAQMDIQAGDFLLLASPSSWTMGTSGSGRAVDFKSVVDDPACLISSACDPTITRFIAGAFVFAAPNADLLTGLMHPVIHVRGANIVADRLEALLRILGDEALASRPGRSLILDRLLEIMLVESLRHRAGDLAGAKRGLLAGLEDVHIGAALRLMHQEVQRPWTVAMLARQVGMSRSSFAARFTETLGTPPMDYLLNWRMNLAKAALTSSKKPMSEIAELAGYQSVSAFSTAFSRATGCSPTAYMRMSA